MATGALWYCLKHAFSDSLATPLIGFTMTHDAESLVIDLRVYNKEVEHRPLSDPLWRTAFHRPKRIVCSFQRLPTRTFKSCKEL